MIGLEEALVYTAEAMGGKLSAPAVEIMVSDLQEYPPEEVLVALKRCRHECRGWLALVDILERIPSYHGSTPPPRIRNDHTPAWQYLGGCRPPHPGHNDSWRTLPWGETPSWLREILYQECAESARRSVAADGVPDRLEPPERNGEPTYRDGAEKIVVDLAERFREGA